MKLPIGDMDQTSTPEFADRTNRNKKDNNILEYSKQMKQNIYVLYIPTLYIYIYIGYHSVNIERYDILSMDRFFQPLDPFFRS